METAHIYKLLEQNILWESTATLYKSKKWWNSLSYGFEYDL